eukprot:TRINITY_DN17574_c0_g1_i1.p1 TRINITY_DN17574_c0_g1~~TRINITY_DN17574_c0_g1_i1.p1  ORF type:complete len:204 (+),score=55.23 TRINITY_DN17574_c0_g1_i1:89-700(+)
MVHIEEFPPLPETPGEVSARLHAATLRAAGARLEAAVASSGRGGDASDVAALVAESVRLQAAVAAARAEVSAEQRQRAQAHFALGDALASQEGDFVGGAAEFCRALTADPWHTEALCGLGSALGELGDLDGAVEALRRALHVAPRHGLAHFYLGAALGRRGDVDGALLEFQAVIDYDPDSPAAAIARRNLEAAARAETSAAAA